MMLQLEPFADRTLSLYWHFHAPEWSLWFRSISRIRSLRLDSGCFGVVPDIMILVYWIVHFPQILPFVLVCRASKRYDNTRNHTQRPVLRTENKLERKGRENLNLRRCSCPVPAVKDEISDIQEKEWCLWGWNPSYFGHKAPNPELHCLSRTERAKNECNSWHRKWSHLGSVPTL